MNGISPTLLLVFALAAMSAYGVAAFLVRSRKTSATPQSAPWQLGVAFSPHLASRAGLGAAAGAVLIGLLAGLSLPLLGAVTLLAGFAGGAVAKVAQARWRGEIADQFVRVLDLLTSGVRSGQSLPQAIESAIPYVGEPMRGELRLMSRQLRVGHPAPEVLQGLSERVPSEEVRQATIAMGFGLGSGINLAEVFDEIASSFRARRLLVRKLEALTAMGKGQALVLGALPLIFLAAGAILFPDHLSILLRTEAGNLALLAVAVLQVLTFATVNRLARVEI